MELDQRSDRFLSLRQNLAIEVCQQSNDPGLWLQALKGEADALMEFLKAAVDLKVRSFCIPHDAYDPVGFTFAWGEEGDLISPPRSLAWVTDLGYVPDYVKEHICDVQTLVIESNYDEDLLESDERRPWSTKHRIRGRHGHLSNHAAFELVEALSTCGTLEKVYLAHVSQDCNSVDIDRDKLACLQQKLSIDIIDPEGGIASALTCRTC